MKNLKHFLVFVILVFFSIYLVDLIDTSKPISFLLPFLIIGFFIFNLIVRKSLSFKNYFCSRYNLFTSKSKFEILYEIPKELMFEKVIEVIQSSKFKLVETDQEKFEILATSPMTIWTWGENIYISFESIGKETQLKFCSTSFFGMYSWGKNEKNYDDFFNQIESSLII